MFGVLLCFVLLSFVFGFVLSLFSCFVLFVVFGFGFEECFRIFVSVLIGLLCFNDSVLCFIWFRFLFVVYGNTIGVPLICGSVVVSSFVCVLLFVRTAIVCGLVVVSSLLSVLLFVCVVVCSVVAVVVSSFVCLLLFGCVVGGEGVVTPYLALNCRMASAFRRSASACVCVCVCVCVYVCARVYPDKVYVCACVCVDVYVCMCVCVFVCL